MRQQYATSRVLKIEDKELSTFELDKDFKIVQGSIRPVPSYAEKYLAGVWHEVPRVRNLRRLSILIYHLILANFIARQSGGPPFQRAHYLWKNYARTPRHEGL